MKLYTKGQGTSVRIRYSKITHTFWAGENDKYSVGVHVNQERPTYPHTHTEEKKELNPNIKMSKPSERGRN